VSPVRVGTFLPLGRSAAAHGAPLARAADEGVDQVCVGGEDRREIEVCGVDPRRRGRRRGSASVTMVAAKL
jgi:hypothetical protein